MSNSHENYEARSHTPDMGSNRSFGITFGLIFLAVSLYAFYRETAWAIYALIAGGGFLAVAYTMPTLLTPLNKIWFQFGLLLHKIINPLIMGVLFFLVLTPMAVFCKIMKKDLLKLNPCADKNSYWIVREDDSEFENQF